MITEISAVLLSFVAAAGIMYAGSKCLISIFSRGRGEWDRLLYRFYYDYHPKPLFIESQVRDLQKLFEEVGKSDFSSQSFLILKEISAVAGFFLGWFLMDFFTGLLFGFLLYFYPDARIRSKVAERKKSIRRDFPEFVDLLALIVESGVDFSSALERISQFFVEGHLKDELQFIVEQMKRGMRRREILEDWVRRMDIEEIQIFSLLLIQAEETGASMGKVLRDLAERVRDERFAYVEKKASQLPVKLMLPLFLIFGAILMVIFSLILAQIMEVL